MCVVCNACEQNIKANITIYGDVSLTAEMLMTMVCATQSVIVVVIWVSCFWFLLNACYVYKIDAKTCVHHVVRRHTLWSYFVILCEQFNGVNRKYSKMRTQLVIGTSFFFDGFYEQLSYQRTFETIHVNNQFIDITFDYGQHVIWVGIGGVVAVFIVGNIKL